MITFTIEVTDERWERRTKACLPIPPEELIKNPDLTESEWAVMCSKQDLDRGLIKRERQKNRYQSVAVKDDDITISVI